MYLTYPLILFGAVTIVMCFFAEDDLYKYVLAERLKRYGAQLHAYCLMTNHVHLLITPFTTDSISRILQYIGRHTFNTLIKYIVVLALYGRDGIKEVWLLCDDR